MAVVERLSQLQQQTPVEDTAMEHAAAVIQARFRGKMARDEVIKARKIDEQRRGRIQNRRKSHAEREMLQTLQQGSTLEQLTEVAQMKRALIEATHSPWVIDPNYAEWTQWWDLGMMALLIVVLFMTPFEVAFLSPKVDALFCINRLFDFMFMADLGINFFLAYQNGPEKGGTWRRFQSRQ